MAGSPLDFDFDFTNLIISGKAPGEFDVENDIYSDWKELVAGGGALEGSAPPAFLESNDGFTRAGGSIGGNALGGGQQIAPYFFMNNVDGWTFRSAEADGETILNGNLFPLDPLGSGLFVPTLGAFTSIIKLVVSPQSIVTIPEGTGLTAEESLLLKEIHALVAGDAVVSLDDLTVTIYDTTVSPREILAVYSISADSRIRTRTT